LGDTSLENCTFKSGLRYCGVYYVGDAQTPMLPPDTGADPIRVRI
jgi:hypothetical protein